MNGHKLAHGLLPQHLVAKGPACQHPITCSRQTMQPQQHCLWGELLGLHCGVAHFRHHTSLLRDGALRSQAATEAEALFSSQLEASTLPLSSTMFSSPSWKAAPHKTFSLLTISVTLYCPKYTKQKKKIPPIPSHPLAQMQEKVKHAEWGAQERSPFLSPMHSARIDSRMQNLF